MDTNSLVSKLPLYRQIQAVLKENITSGIYPEGSMIKSEHELCQEFNATRMTVRQALNELVKEGYITRHQGKGSVVSAIRKSLGLLSLKGWTEVVSASERHGTTLTLDGPKIQAWPEPFDFPLSESEKNANCIFINRLRYADDVPVMLEFTYLPNFGLEDLISEPLIDGSLFRTLFMKYQIDVAGLSQEIRAVAANKQTANLLKLPPKSPVLHIIRRYNTSKEGYFFYSSTFCNTEKFAISGFNE
jgi:DNA-binding GntR family transcriptional regulator